MSLPWNRSVGLHVGQDEVRATSKSGWPRVATLAEARCRVEPVDAGSPAPSHATAADLPTLAGAVGAVLQKLAANSPLKGGDLHVELSSALLHLDIVEGDFAGLADRQLTEIATACAAEILGDTVADHEIRSQLQRDGRHLVIAAIDRSLLSMLSDGAQACGLRLASVRPEFVVQWNAHGRSVRPGECVFAVSAPRDLAIATTLDGAITSISVGPPVDLRVADDAPAAAAVERTYAKPVAGLRLNASAGASHGVFSPSRPQSPIGADALDLRVDRMLVAGGRDPEAQSRFVLVSPNQPSIEASARWSNPAQRSAQA